MLDFELSENRAKLKLIFAEEKKVIIKIMEAIACFVYFRELLTKLNRVLFSFTNIKKRCSSLSSKNI